MCKKINEKCLLQEIEVLLKEVDQKNSSLSRQAEEIVKLKLQVIYLMRHGV